MSGWVRVLVSVAAAITALGIITSKGLIPMWRAARKADEMIPLMAQLVDQLQDVPDVFAILREIVGQVRSDSGSSLLDIIKRLEAASTANAASNTALLSLLSSLGARVDIGAATGIRHEQASAIVAADLVIAQAAVDGVAADLAEADHRADVVTGSPGEAADEASRSGHQHQ